MMNMGSHEKLVIRDFLPNDAENLKRFWTELAKEMYKIEGYIVPSTKNAEVWLSYVLKEVEEARMEVLVAQRGTELVGFILLAYATDERFETAATMAVIHDMYVEPDHRGLGVGTMLMKGCMKKVERKGVKQVRLSVLSENVGAVRFYKRHGFDVYRYGMRKEIH